MSTTRLRKKRTRPLLVVRDRARRISWRRFWHELDRGRISADRYPTVDKPGVLTTMIAVVGTGRSFNGLQKPRTIADKIGDEIEQEVLIPATFGTT